MGPTPARPKYRRLRPSGWAGIPQALVAMLWALAASATQAAPADAATGAALGAPEGVAVYRCRGPGGGTEFREDPCPAGTQGEALLVEDHPVGWTPTPAPKRTASDHRTKPGASAGQGKGKGKSSARSARERQQENCEKKRDQVEEIDRKLRLGAKPRQGTELRHRRRVYEDYLDGHCD